METESHLYTVGFIYFNYVEIKNMIKPILIFLNLYRYSIITFEI